MIRKKLTIVLGAGASNPYGYPLGDGLKDKVKSVLRNSQFRRALESGYGQRPDILDLIDSFVEDLEKYKASSIDRFLSSRSDSYKAVGKVAIAKVIMDCEKDDKLFSAQNCWYNELYKILGINLNNTEMLHEKLCIVTFNYDRSLEHFLYERLIGDFDVSNKDKIVALLNQIPIFHIHGRVNPLKWQDQQNGRSYKIDGHMPNIFDMSEKLLIPIDSSGETERMQSNIQNSSQIFFIGFGYDKTNLSKLGFECMDNAQKIIGTCKGVSVHMQNEIRRMFINSKLEFTPAHVDAYEFMMNHFVA